MSKYTRRPAVIDKSAEELFAKFDDLSVFEERLNQLPPEQLAKVGEINFTPDSITISTSAMGTMSFEVVERVAPTKITFSAVGSPLPLSMIVNFNQLSSEQTEIVTEIDVEVPAMIRAFIGPKLQEAADKFGEMMTNLSK